MRFVRRHILTVAAFIVLGYLFIPVAVVGVLSFNDPPSKYNTKWYGFSLDAWTNMCGIPGVCESFIESIKIGLISTFVATVLGTMVAFALVRYRFRGRKTTNLLIFLPMATPEVVMGSLLHRSCRKAHPRQLGRHGCSYREIDTKALISPLCSTAWPLTLSCQIPRASLWLTSQEDQQWR